jgi:hypothetical protein
MTQTADMTVRRRNAAIKKVLQQRFGDVPISVRGESVRGHTINCKVAIDIPPEQETGLKEELVRMIRHAGIDLPCWAYVDDTSGDWRDVPCIRFGFDENEAWVQGKA